MPQPRVITLVVTASATAAGVVTNWIPIDYRVTTFNLAYQVDVAGDGTVVYTVESTLQEVTREPTVTAGAIINVTAGATTDTAGNITSPVAALRLNVTDSSGATTLTFRTLQSGY